MIENENNKIVRKESLRVRSVIEQHGGTRCVVAWRWDERDNYAIHNACVQYRSTALFVVGHAMLDYYPINAIIRSSDGEVLYEMRPGEAASVLEQVLREQA